MQENIGSAQYSHPLRRFHPAQFASSSTPRLAPRTHGPSFCRTQLRASLLLPLSRHRQTRDPRPRRRRDIRLVTIHERRDLGTGEVTGKHCHRHKCRRVRRWYLLRQEIWGFDNSLERRRGAHEIGLCDLPDLPHSLQSVLASSENVCGALLLSPHRASTKSDASKSDFRVLSRYSLHHVPNPTFVTHDPTPMSQNSSTFRSVAMRHMADMTV